MTVQELIEKLQQIEHKDKVVYKYNEENYTYEKVEEVIEYHCKVEVK